MAKVGSPGHGRVHMFSSISRFSEVVSGVSFGHLVELFTLIKMGKWNASYNLCEVSYEVGKF